MFLNDELLKMCEDYEGTTGDEVQALNIALCEKCENYYKSKITPQSSLKTIKTTLDRTFRLWDSFIRMAKEHKSNKVKILAELFEKFTFKKQWLSNSEMAIIYKNL